MNNGWRLDNPAGDSARAQVELEKRDASGPVAADPATSAPQSAGLEGRLPDAAASAVLEYPLAGPWKRWCARLFDLWWEASLVGLGVGVVLGLTSGDFLRWLDKPGASKLVGILCIPVALLLDALVHACFGNTPGKALLGLRVGLVDGRRPSLGQHLSRNVGVWAGGLGLGIPLVTLFTMGRQHRRLNQGEQASYDDEGYRVRAKPIGWPRRIGFGVAFLVLFGCMTALEVFDRDEIRKARARQSAPPLAWTNPDTGRSASVVADWRYARETSVDGMVLHQFTQHSEHAVVILAAEEANDMSLEEYARAWTAQTMAEWRVPGGYFEDFRGHRSWIATGEQQGGILRIKIRLVEVENKVWRVMTIQAPPLDYTDALVEELHGRLWDTVAPGG